MTNQGTKKPRVLVTGASGFLGRHIVQWLVNAGLSVRAFVRTNPTTSEYHQDDVEFVCGDITELSSLRKAFDGIDVVIHAAADTTGSEKGGIEVTLGGTLHVLTLCRRFNVSRLVYISSCAVYETVSARDGASIREDARMESHPDKRGAYSHYKCLAETAVRRAMQRDKTSIVILRPGTIYSEHLDMIPPNIGYRIRDSWLFVIDSMNTPVSLVHVNNAAHAVLLSLNNDNAIGEIFNIVDPELVFKSEYIARIIRRAKPSMRVVRLPFFVVHAGVYFLEFLWKMIGKEPPLTLYRLKSSQQNVRFDGSKIIAQFHWTPETSFESAIRKAGS